MSDSSRPFTSSSREKRHDFLESLTNPRNAAEYILAMTVPNSPVRKELMTELTLAIEEKKEINFNLFIIIEIILNYEVREKADLIKDELKSQEKIREIQQQIVEIQQAVDQRVKEIKKSTDPEELAKQKEQLSERNQELQEKLNDMETRLSELQDDMVSIKQDCLDSQKKVTDEAIENLSLVTYVPYQGKPMQFDRDIAETFRDQLTPPSLAQHHKVNRGLFETIADVMVESGREIEEFAETAGKAIMDLGAALNPLKLIGYIEGEDRPTGPALLKHLKASGSTALVNASTLRYQSSDYKTNARAMGNLLQQCVCENEIKDSRSEIRNNKVLIAAIDTRSAELARGVDNSPASEIPPAPEAPEAPEPSKTSWRLPTPRPGGGSR